MRPLIPASVSLFSFTALAIQCAQALAPNKVIWQFRDPRLVSDSMGNGMVWSLVSRTRGRYEPTSSARGYQPDQLLWYPPATYLRYLLKYLPYLYQGWAGTSKGLSTLEVWDSG